MIADHFPLLGLRIEVADLQLRLPSPEQLGQLADVAADGVHEPGMMPFGVPWTEQSAADRARSVVTHHWATLGRWTPEAWSLPLVVLHRGTVVGQQAISAKEFAITTECSTGSWLGLRHHGRGIGTLMRTAVAHLAFEHLGATDLVSSAYLDNPASLRVSAKLGYQPDGIARWAVQGRLRISQRLRLTRHDWRTTARPPVQVHGLQPCLPLFGLAE
ncbi:GNAT family N-acetyltransferase [Catellatospora tritici]|uniref:GNAT family N-acetyltransferase n=1 Tax=Catellatospora tritici TaxID=2851566 RepID=UPI001C2D5229|nr:GNAT family protein [Catellatospora tritici]MBV1853947.1 GNAT family N-acetyltransferase [Catellatospora tritici]